LCTLSLDKCTNPYYFDANVETTDLDELELQNRRINEAKKQVKSQLSTNYINEDDIASINEEGLYTVENTKISLSNSIDL